MLWTTVTQQLNTFMLRKIVAQHGLLSLLVQVVIYKLPTLKFCHGNQTNGHCHKTHKLVDNHQMIITAKYGSHRFICYEENAI